MIKRLLSIALLLGICSCTTVNSAPGSGYEGWVPFIESVEAPELLTVGEEGRITLSLSAQLRPELLSNNVYAAHVILTGGNGDGTVLNYDTAISPAPPQGNIWPMLPESSGSRIVFPIMHSRPGTYTIVLHAAANRSDGGAQVHVITTPSSGIFSDKVQLTATQVTYTVVPAT